jgi:thioredoxin reductase (NADPH)
VSIAQNMLFLLCALQSQHGASPARRNPATEMRKPVILTVDDDADVLHAVERDLRRRYGEQYRITGADSGQSALEIVRQLKLRGDVVSLFLVDQRMPRMTGVEFLAKGIKDFPRAKRVLLTAYADTEAAINAINEVQIDHYLIKPWDPPEERLYPVLDDLLEHWLRGHHPQFEGIRVIGQKWSPQAHEVKYFLARHQIPFKWLDFEIDAEARSIVEHAGNGGHLPLVLFPDGSYLFDPTLSQLGEKLGLKAHPEMAHYDLVIIGAGPAGLAAAVYGASEGLRTVMIERVAPGGQAGSSSRIENYLGFPAGLSGGDLARRAVAQARRFGAEILTPQHGKKIRLNGQYRVLTLSDDSEINCQALLIATGVSYRQLEVPGLERLTGAGVYYGSAMTEEMYCRDQDVYIVGAGNSAGQAAMYLSRFARCVKLLARGDSLAKSMSQYLIDELARTPNVVVQLQTRVIEAHGENHLESITIANDQTGQTTTAPAVALFIFIGATPHTTCVADLIEHDERGYILSGTDLTLNGRRPRNWPLERKPYLLETNVPGIFVAGDVRHGSIKRVASAVGEGSIAIELIHQYLDRV